MIQYTFCKAASFMASPCVGGWNRIKRAARFLRAHPRWAVELVEQERQALLRMSADSDWAGDPLHAGSVGEVTYFVLVLQTVNIGSRSMCEHMYKISKCREQQQQSP